MREIDLKQEKATLELDFNELLALKNALNEVCNGIDAPEFHSRLGVTLDEAEALLAKLKDVVDRMWQPSR